MRFDLSTIVQLILQTFRDPAAMAGRIMQLRVPDAVGWMTLALVTILTVIAISLERLLPNQPEMVSQIGISPMGSAVFVGALTMMFIGVIAVIGKAMGGTGSFNSTLLMMTWFQTIVLFLVVIQLAAMLISPAISALISLVGLGLQLYCLMHFLNVLHGFDSLAKACGLFVFSILGLVLGMVVLLLMAGGTGILGIPT